MNLAEFWSGAWSGPTTAAIVNHLWQSTMVAGAAWMLAVALRKNHARVRYWVWMAASVKFLVPFSVLMGLGAWLRSLIPAEGSRPAVASVMEQVAQPFAQGLMIEGVKSASVTAHRVSLWPVALLLIWICGAAAVAIQFGRGWWSVYLVKRSAWPIWVHHPSGAKAQSLLSTSGTAEAVPFQGSDHFKESFGSALVVPMLCSPELIEPGIFGIIRPVLLLPEGIVEQLEPEQLRAILAHEMCHVRRRDNLTFALHLIVEMLFWFFPLVWWIGARLIEEREQACDEAVLRAATDPQDYAEGIIAVCRYCLKSPFVCVSGVAGSNLKRRVEAIMMNRSMHGLSFSRRLLLTGSGFAAVVLPLAVGTFHLPPVRAQQPAAPLEFDVASVKPSNPNSRNGTVVSITPGGRLHVVNATLKDLIETAYDVRSFQIEGGPKWADATRYDIDATPGTLPQGVEDEAKVWTDVRFEIQALLKDRFQLQLHRETKTAPVYSLVVAKGGIKSSDLSATQSPSKGVNAGQGTMLGEAASMAQLAYKLSRLLQRPVVNNTGLEGNYDFKLEWIPDPGPSAPDGQPSDIAAGPSIFSALQQQLGLCLEATRGPVDILVIDHVDKPSAN